MSVAQYLPDDYIYASARLRAREMPVMRHSYLLQLAEKPSAEDVVAALVSDGVLREEATADLEAALEELVRGEFRAVSSFLPHPELLAFLQYPVDCHNLKVALKCHYRGIDPTPLFDRTGSVDIAELSVLPRELPAALPTHMKQAVDVARKAYEQSGDPRAIDLAIDGACFADMAAKVNGIPLAEELVRARADITNLFTCKRLLAMGISSGEQVLSQAFVTGGEIAKEDLLAAYRGGEEALEAFACKSVYRTLFASCGQEDPERLADHFYLAIARSAARVLFGIEVAVAYLQGLLIAVKNLRILYTAKRTGAEQSVLLGRLRESYV